MKRLAKISMLVAVMIALLHSLIPHEHHAELSETEHASQHESADDLFDLIRLAFHLDLGEDHLETYQASDLLDFDIDCQYILSESFSGGIQPIEFQVFPSWNHSSRYAPPPCRSNRHRAPPHTA